MSILIVDDNTLLLNKIRRSLTQMKHPVRTATSVAEARRALRQRPPKVLCLHLQLPDGNGLDLLQDLEHTGQRFPVVIISGKCTDENRARAARLGAAGFLAKPFSLRALHRTLARLLDGDQQGDRVAPGADNTASYPTRGRENTEHFASLGRRSMVPATARLWRRWTVMRLAKLQKSTTVLLWLLLMVFGANAPVFAQSRMYWTDTFADTIQRANLDGSNIETVVNGVTASLGIAVDRINGKIYWVDIGQFISGFGDEVIRRANLDGSGVETLLTTADGLRHPWAINVDPAGGKIYWADGNTQKIYRANLDGSSLEIIIDVPSFRAPDYAVGTGVDRNLEFSNVGGLALDVVHHELYWTDYFAGDIHRASMDGTVDVARIDQLVSGLTTPRGIALDETDGRMYWVTGAFGSEVMRAFTDGTGIEVLVGKNLGTRLKQPFRIDLDTVAGLMYWSDRDTGLIQRASLDGSGVTTLLTLEYEKKPGEFRPSSPTGFALDLIGDTAPAPTPAPDPAPAPAPDPTPGGTGGNGTPDLTGTIDKLRVSPKNGNDQLEFEFTVTNAGTGPMVGAYTIRAFLSTTGVPDPADTLLQTWATGQGLGTGGSQKFKSKLDLSGSHVNQYVLIVIDADHTIDELDENNNLLAAQIR